MTRVGRFYRGFQFSFFFPFMTIPLLQHVHVSHHHYLKTVVPSSDHAAEFICTSTFTTIKHHHPNTTTLTHHHHHHRNLVPSERSIKYEPLSLKRHSPTKIPPLGFNSQAFVRISRLPKTMRYILSDWVCWQDGTPFRMHQRQFIYLSMTLETQKRTFFNFEVWRVM